jgi:hypothetical protein
MKDFGRRVEGLARALVALLVLVVLLAPRGFVAARAAAESAVDSATAAAERQVMANPEDLRLAAAYRQLIIGGRDFDRSIKLFERLASRPVSGPNVHISLALAYVDKVPVATPFRRIFLGRDAMHELTLAVDREPSPMGFYIRGLVSLYYPESVFHRTRIGIADLEHARTLALEQPPHPSHARVYMSLGDAYWKLHDLARAVSIWTDGLNRFPDDDNLRLRLASHGPDLDRLLERVLDPATRVDTSLREVFGSSIVP